VLIAHVLGRGGIERGSQVVAMIEGQDGKCVIRESALLQAAQLAD
jgi:hypothetical protein